MGQGFSFASVILSYFLVGGGMFSATLVAYQVHISGEIALYAALAGGALVGGFVAARASRGETILEPALGAIAVIATIVGLAAATSMGEQLWASAHDQTLKFIGGVGVSSVIGAVVGAYIAEKLGEATRSSVPWLIYTAMSVFGACLLATLVASTFMIAQHKAEASETESGVVGVVGIAIGCLIAGFAVGASARTRPLFASFLGGGLGIAGYVALIIKLGTALGSGPDSEVIAGLAILAAAGAVVTLIGTALGWSMFGRKYAAGPDPAQLGRQFQ
ncbi:MAG TPA: hypothetical protein VGD80_25555 [Kofleriaceae bacterium]